MAKFWLNNLAIWSHCPKLIRPILLPKIDTSETSYTLLWSQLRIKLTISDFASISSQRSIDTIRMDNLL